MYLYVFLDPRKKGPFEYDYYHWTFRFSHEPFYVGIGAKKSRTLLCKNRNRYFKNKAAKIQRQGLEPILKVYERETWETVCFLEQVLIRAIGRWDKKRGPLVNFTEGGEGSWGRKLSPASIAKMKKSLKGRCTRSPEMCKRVGRMLKGRKHTDKARANMSAAQKKRYKERPMTRQHIINRLNSWLEGNHEAWNKGRPRSKATRQKVSQSLMGSTPWNKRNWVIHYPDGSKKKVKDLQFFCDTHDLNYSTFRASAQAGGRLIRKGPNAGFCCKYEL